MKTEFREKKKSKKRKLKGKHQVGLETLKDVIGICLKTYCRAPVASPSGYKELGRKPQSVSAGKSTGSRKDSDVLLSS